MKTYCSKNTILSFHLILFFFISSYTFGQGPGSLFIDAGPDVVIDCGSTGCADLTASFLETFETSSETYTVESIDYVPPFSFDGLANSLNTDIDDAWSPVDNLPFDFCFFGNLETEFQVGSNGVIRFEVDAGDSFNQWNFDENLPNNTEEALSEANVFTPVHDINPAGSSGQIGYEVLGEYPNRVLVVSYFNIPMFGCSAILASHMAVFYEFSNVIEIYIQDKPSCEWNSGNAALGIQNNEGTVAYVPPGRNTSDSPWTTTNEAWRFTPDGDEDGAYSFEWLDASGTVIGTDPTINVCPLGASATYTARISYTNTCNGDLVVLTDEVMVVTSIQPIITAPNNINIYPDPGSCVATSVDIGTPTVTGACGIQTISNDAPTEFPLGVTQVQWTIVDDSGIEDSDTQTITVTLNAQPTITAPDNITIGPDSGSCIATNVDIGTANIAGGCGTQTISNNAPNEFPLGDTQVVWTLVDGSGIESTDTQTVTVTLQVVVVDVADVCYVSSDQVQVTNNRIFITNNPTNSGLYVAYYEVLRESQSGAYDPIGFITPPEVSFLDIESNNASQAYRYKIRTTDVCGASYPESSFHKTILLQSGIASDNSINLSWTPYLGLDFTTYNIFKNTNGTGYELLTSLSFNNTTYNDTSANVVDNFYEYYISIEVASCGSDPLLPFNLRSNLELVNPNLSITNTNWLNQEIQIYPNPTSDYINISFPNQIEITTVSIYNALGQLVFDTNKFENIYISNLTTGLYYLSINTNQGVVNKTMIRE
ncbi:T9SS type A sorting domain-containing protein [Flavobacteriaceae bacterium]|nr:T9SS type A sorting domain-containing protein [Flavobacteriaceae bacterium]